jgi:hypothetical protein
MRHLLITLTFLLFQGCTNLNLGRLNTDSSSGAYNPMTVDGVNVEKFKADKALCLKQVQAENETTLSDYFNTVKFRACLIKKEYILMN